MRDDETRYRSDYVCEPLEVTHELTATVLEADVSRSFGNIWHYASWRIV